MVPTTATSRRDDLSMPIWALLTFIVVHSALFIHDIYVPEAFFSGDRGISRLDKIYALFGPYLGSHTFMIPEFVLPDGLSFIDRLLALAAPGDYIIHGLLYVIGGKYMVIAFQVLLMFGAFISVYRLAILAGLNRRVPTIVALLFMFLPTSLMAPHTLATEGIFTPLSTITIYLIVSATDRELRPQVLYFGLFLVSVCTFVRLQMLLFPFVIAASFLLFDRARAMKTVPAALTLSFVLPVAWLLFSNVVGTGHETAADNSVLLEFYKITKRVAPISGFAFDPSAYPDERMSPGEFLGYFFAHPIGFIKTKAIDLLNMFINPGVNTFFGRHLGLLDTMTYERDGLPYHGYWRDLRDKAGLIGVVVQIFKSEAAFAVSFVVGTALWSVVILGAVVGVWRFLTRSTLRASSLFILCVYPLYTVGILCVANTNRWDHRSPFDFMTVLLAGFTLQWILTRRERGTQPTQRIPSTPSKVSATPLPHGTNR